MKQFRGAALLMITALIWGTAFVAQSLGLDHLEPMSFISVRNAIATLALLPVVLFMRKRRPKDEKKQYSRRTLWIGGIACGVVLSVASVMQQAGMKYTTVGKAGFLTALYIVMVPLFGLFAGKRVSFSVWISVALAAVGTYLLSMNGDMAVNSGDLLVILSAVGFSIHIILVDHFSPMVSGVELSCIQFLSASVFTGIGALIFEAPTPEKIFLTLGPLLYTGVFSSGVGYTLQIIGQKDTPPTVASLIMSLESVFAAISGWLFLNQGMQSRELYGCVLVFAAVILAQIPFSAIKRRHAEKS